jgi:ankyrin repeat protein
MVSMGFRCEPDDLELSFVLCEAASAGQLEMVQQLLEAGAWESTAWSEPKLVRECSCGSTDWYSCEHWERWRNDEELAGLIEQGHPFLLAARSGHTDVCSLLFKQGIHVGVVHEAVCAAAAGGHLAVIQRLLQEGPAGLSQLADVSNAMFEAAAGGHLDVAQFFLGQGADLYSFRGTPWAGESDFTSCLEAAAAGGCPELLQLLLNDYGMAVEPDWPKVLEAAVRSGNNEAVHVLLTAAAAEGQDGEVGSSAAHLIPRQPPQAVQQEAMKQLLRQQQQGEVQQILANCVRSYQLLQLQSLLPPWAKLDEALLLAARLGHTNVIILLLNCGDRRFSHQLFTAALQVAASKGHSDLIPVLISHSADVNAESRGPHLTVPDLDGSHKADVLFPGGDRMEHLYTPLGQALLGGHWAAAGLLMAWGAKTWDQFLAFAIYKRAPARTVQLLLDRGVRDSKGHAGIYAAAHNGQQEVVELLLGVGQRSISCDTLGCRFDAALSGAALGQQPQVVDYLCAALSRAQDNGRVPAANRQDILNTALLLSAKASKYYVEEYPVVLPAPAAIDPLGGQGLPAAGDDPGQAQAGEGQAAHGLPGEQQQPGAEAVHTFELVKRLHPASENHVRVVRLLLQHGADPDHEQGQVLAEAVRRQYEEGAILWYGGQRQDHAILQELLNAGAGDVDAALVAAADTGDAAAVPKLVAATQGPVDPEGKALLAAAAHNNTNVVTSLIDLKANVAAALSAAAATNNVQAATVILEHPQVRVTDQGLKQQLVDLAAKSKSFSLLWALCKALGMLHDCELPDRV